MRLALLAAVLVALTVGFALPAEGAFRLRTQVGALVLEAPPEVGGSFGELADLAEPLMPRLEEILGVRAAGPITMVLIPPGPIDDPDVARLDRAAPAWAAGFALNEQRIGGIRLGRAGRYPFGDAGAVLAHEVVHVLLHDAAGERMPRWFSEGVATSIQRRWTLKDAVVYSSSLVLGPLPTLDQMDRAFVRSEASARTAYAASFDFVEWASDEYGEDVVRRVLDGLQEGLAFSAAWRRATGDALADSEDAWRGTALTWYRWLPALTGAGTLWLGITMLFLLATWSRRVKTRRTMERLAAEDAYYEASLNPPPPRRDAGRDGDGNWVN